LKPEMLRADRFDKIFFVGLPAYEERKHIFNIYLSQIDTKEEYDLDSLASATQFMTGAEILSLIKETKFYVTSENLRPINTQDILNHAPTMRNTIWQKNPDMVRSMYRYAADQWDWASSLQQEESYLILGGKANRPKKQVALT
jgi:ATP-dependent 26S proteasome regulatory subunit